MPSQGQPKESTPVKMKKDPEGAFKWIVGKFRELQIPFQITGGLAARSYGATRELADIDFDVPEKHFAALATALKEHIIFGPEHLKDDNWDLSLITLRYKGQDIDIGGAYETNFFDREKRKWVPLVANLATAQERELFGIKVPVVDRAELIEYKSKLARDVDKEDVRAIQ